MPVRQPLPLAAARRLLSKATGSQEGVESLKKSANPAVAAQQLAGDDGAPEAAAAAAAEGEDLGDFRWLDHRHPPRPSRTAERAGFAVPTMNHFFLGANCRRILA